MPAGGRTTRSAEPTFDVALREAITRRGLGLARLQERLEKAGYPVSQATLSYWQSGRSQPERADSLRALAVLEEVLEVEPGHLRGMLVPARRRRLQPVANDPVIVAALPQWPEMEDRVVRALTRSRFLSVHDDMVLGPDRRSTQRIRALQRAQVDGLDRTYLYVAQESDAFAPPSVEARGGCALGETSHDEDKTSVIAELLFTEPLARGEVSMVDYVVHLGQFAVDAHERREIVSIRELVMSVTFHPDDLPARVWQVTEVAGERQLAPIPLRSDGVAQVTVFDFGPGQTGITWEWDDSAA